MPANLEPYLWWMPSPRLLLEGLAAQAARRANTCLVLPDLVEPARVAEQLAKTLAEEANGRQEAMQPYTLDVSDRFGADPVVEVSRALRLNGGYQLERILAAEQNRAIIVYGVDRKVGHAETWAAFARQWAAADSSRRAAGPALFLLCRLPRAPLPAPAERFQHIFWKDMPSALEVSLCCRIHGIRVGLEPVRQRWLEATLSSVAAGDIDLAGFLWDAALDSSAAVVGALCEFARWKGWTEADADSALRMDADLRRKNGRPAQDTAQKLWAAGWQLSTPEYGSEPHPALVALRDGEQIFRRLWRGQAALVLPEVDTFRARILQKVRAAYPRDWRLSDTAELGETESFLHRFARSGPQTNAWLGQLKFVRVDVRNRLAHYTPVEFKDYLRLLQLNRVE
jgi:hypothetical protein